MAKNNDKRAERMARSNRNVNRAITVLMAGVIAEFYLLMVNNYYVKGGVGQVLTMMTVLQVIDYIGCALFGAGLVVWLMRKKWTRFAPAAPWLLCIGFFFAVSSILMLKVYPQGTTMMCVIVPVVMLIGVVFLLYPREFSVQAVGLTASLMAMYLIHRGSGSDTWGGIVTGCSILAICVVAVLGVAVFKAGKNDGKLKKLGDSSVSCRRTATTSSIYAVLAVCALAIVAALAVSSIAYYGPLGAGDWHIPPRGVLHGENDVKKSKGRRVHLDSPSFLLFICRDVLLKLASASRRRRIRGGRRRGCRRRGA